LPEKITFFSQATEGSSYINGNKIDSHLRRTDTSYWEILDFNFLNGRTFDQAEFDSGQMVAVINKKTQKNYFSGENPIGKNIIINEQTFSVIGVVEDVFVGETHAYADIWVPYTTFASTQFETELMGGWSALLYHSNPSILPQIQQEYVNQLKNDFVTHDPEQFHKAIGGADTKLERIAREMTNTEDYESNAASMITMWIVLVLCFMLLPSINLINLNISRIMERSSEIGVRKAFGAKTGQLVIQFVVENILITAIGGGLGLLVSWGVLSQIEASGVLPGADVNYNWRVFLYGFGFVFVFGLLSGTYPALKMSRLHPVTALKGGVR
ncbi:MAG: ABC transporter permease, partial [Kangiellaceae bacterium]|nr:ABC transporter permease [Kangiellaceae bacterium]